MKNYTCILIAFFLTPLSIIAQSKTDTAVHKIVKVPKGFTKQLDVVYIKVGDWEGKMDIYLPPNTGKLVPLIINIHGGAWRNGYKESQNSFHPYFTAGFAIANIEYRSLNQAKAPAAIEDARCALIYLIKNAKTLHIDVNKIIMMGNDSGGHLALMVGLLGNNPLFDTNCSGVENIKIAAIVDKYGITDVWDWAYGAVIKNGSARQWLGYKAKNRNFALSVSPISYVSKNSPPVFIVHGDADHVLPYQQSVDLYQKLLDLEAKAKFLTIKGGGHGKFSDEDNSNINIDIIDFILNLDGFK